MQSKNPQNKITTNVYLILSQKLCVPSTQQYVVSYLGNAQRRRALCRDHCIACPRVRVWGYCNCECGCHPRTTHCTATTTTSYRQLCIRGTAKILSQHNQWARIDTIEWSHIDKLQSDTNANHDTPMTTDNRQFISTGLTPVCKARIRKTK